MVAATSVGVIGSGVILAIVGPGPSIWLFAHKAFFVLWFAAMAVHVAAYAPKLPHLLSNSQNRHQMRRILAGAGRRWLLLTGSLIVGLVIALATYHLAYSWTGLHGHS